MLDAIYGFFAELQNFVLVVFGAAFSGISEHLQFSEPYLWILAAMLAFLFLY